MVEQDKTRPPLKVMQHEAFTERALDRLLPHAQQIARESQWTMGGLVVAATIRHRDELAGISASDSFVRQAIPLLSPAGMYTGMPRREVLEHITMDISRLRQQWDALSLTDTLAPVAVENTIHNLPDRIGVRRLAPTERETIQRRFHTLTAPRPPR